MLVDAGAGTFYNGGRSGFRNQDNTPALQANTLQCGTVILELLAVLAAPDSGLPRFFRERLLDLSRLPSRRFEIRDRRSKWNEDVIRGAFGLVFHQLHLHSPQYMVHHLRIGKVCVGSILFKLDRFFFR